MKTNLFVSVWDTSSKKAAILEEGIVHYAWVNFGINIISINVEVSEHCMSQKLVITGYRIGTVHNGRAKVSVDITNINMSESGVHIWARLCDVVSVLKAKYLTAQVLEMRW